MADIDKNIITYLSQLCRIACTEQEQEALLKDLKNILVDSININLQKSHYFCHFLIFLIPFKFGILVLLWLLMLLHRVSTLFQDGSANEAVLQFAYLLLYLSCQANDHMKLTSFYNPTSLTTIFPPTCPSLNFQNICP